VSWVAQRAAFKEHHDVEASQRAAALGLAELPKRWTARFMHGSPVLDGTRRWPDAALDYQYSARPASRPATRSSIDSRHDQPPFSEAFATSSVVRSPRGAPMSRRSPRSSPPRMMSPRRGGGLPSVLLVRDEETRSRARETFLKGNVPNPYSM